MHSIFSERFEAVRLFLKILLFAGRRPANRPFAKAEKTARTIRKILGRIGYTINKRGKNKNLQIARIYNFSQPDRKKARYTAVCKSKYVLSHNGPVCYTFIGVKSPSEKERSCKKLCRRPSLNVQCFVEKEVKSIFAARISRSCFTSVKSDRMPVRIPRVMHAHEDSVELILICSGSSEYLIHDKKVIIKPGDLLVYNAGVVHDEVSGPDMEVGSYCIAVGGLHMPGLRENALIPG